MLREHGWTFNDTMYLHAESSEGLSSTTISNPRGIPPNACSRHSQTYKSAKAEPPRCLALRTRGGRFWVRVGCMSIEG